MKLLIRRTACLLLYACCLLRLTAQTSPRTRVSLDRDWRFTKGDPPGVDPATLLYDVRPDVKAQDQKERPAEGTYEASKLGVASRPVLKPWILPTGNAFIKDPAKRFVRPAGNPGEDVSYTRPGFDDHRWRLLNLPHDWAVEGQFNEGGVGGGMGRLPSPGVAWYRRHFVLPASDRGKSVSLEIDGAMSYASVWLNGKLLGGWPYGYASWQLDLTPALAADGQNELAIRLDNPPDFSRWYPGAGLYRHVWLTTTNATHVAHWGTQITTPVVSVSEARVDAKVTAENSSNEAVRIEVQTQLYAAAMDGARSGPVVATIAPVSVQVPANSQVDVTGATTIANPHLWGPPPAQQPNRYVAVTTLVSEGKVIDEYETRFGIRTIEYRPDGLFVNGMRVRIQGVNQHHDLGALGSAFNEGAAARQLQELREMGCNAIRMSHNPPAPELLELTDRMGFLVMDEIFDTWTRQKTPFDFHLIFADWHEQDLRAMMRRDRNHPSIMLWSVGNEVGEQSRGEAGAQVLRELVSIAHEEDRTRPATASMNSAKPDSPFAAGVDVISLNYQGEGIRNGPEYENYKGLRVMPQYEPFRERFPQRMILSSESAAAFSSRDIYLFPVSSAISSPARNGDGEDSKTHQVSSYEIYAADFGSSADKVFAAQDSHPFISGEFVWTGWDYLGEPSPYYSSRSSYFGIIDLAGFPKNRFYLYQSRWRPDLPMAHILPHWTWPERVGKVTPVHVFTSGDEAELFLNGRSLGRKKKGPFEYRLRWDDVIYEPGLLKLVAYKNGQPWATDEVHTSGEAKRITLRSETRTVKADGTELAFISAQMIDKDGIEAPRAEGRVHFTVDGPGEIVATDNGDPTDMEGFTAHDRQAFQGKSLVIVRAGAGAPGRITVKASSPGLAEGTLTLTATP